MITIGFTGPRTGITDEQRDRIREVLLPVAGANTEVRHGDCVGADAQFHDIARRLSMPVVIHPPTDNTLRAFCEEERDVIVLPPEPYLRRNQHIVDASSILIAAPKEYQSPVSGGGGTWFTIRYARKVKRETLLVLPDGGVHLEKWTGA